MKRFHTFTAAALLLGMGVAIGSDAAAAVRCHDEVVYHDRAPRDHNHVAGTVIGAVAGGLIGNQIGGGNGKTLATVGGAVAGGAIGHHVAKENSHDRRYRTVERVCRRD